MVSPPTFGDIRKTKEPHRPPPLNLKTESKRSSRSKVKAVRGSVSGPSGAPVQTVQAVQQQQQADSSLRPTSSAGTSGSSSGTLEASGANPRKWIDMDLSKTRPRRNADGRDVSPQGSMRTIIDLDSPTGSEDESDVSPLSEDRLPVHSNKVLAKFFPELQHNFVLPTADPADQKFMPLKGHSRLESEIHARVQSLYQGQVQGDGAANYADSTDASYGSSSLSFRSSNNSLNPSPPPGLHEDSHSTRSRSRGPRMSVQPPRSVSASTTKVSMQDLKNKPLPLAPVMEPSRSHDRPKTQRSSSRCPDCTDRSRSNGHPHSQFSSSKTQHMCSKHTERRRHHHQSQQQLQHHWSEQPSNRGSPRITHASTWQGHDNGEHRSGKRTLLVLDGPLQISRNNGGDLVANRPAPQPAGKPYSSSIHSSSNPNGSSLPLLALDGPKKDGPRRTNSIKSPLDLSSLKKGHKYARSKDSNESIKDGRTPKSRDDSKGFWSKTVKSEDKKNFRNSLSLTMAGFHRKQGSRNESHNRRLSILSSRSETSVEPQVERQSPIAESTTRLSRHLSISESNLDNMSPTSPKREDLLLQLPRLQTHDLGFKNLLDQFATSFTTSDDSAPNAIPDAAPDATPEPLAIAARPSSEESSHPPTPTARSNPPASATSRARETIIAEIDDSKRDTVIRIEVPGKPLETLPVPEVQPTQQGDDEKVVVSNHRSRGSQAYVSTAKASSVFLPPEQVYELDAAPYSPEEIIHELPVESRHNFSIKFPIEEIKDVIVELIMEHIPSLDDLFNFVLVNRRFYRVFKRRELDYIKMALYKMSRPAWELREMSPPWNVEWQLTINPDSKVPEYSPNLYLDRYARDIFTLAQLKSMILVRCSPFLRRDTVRGLAGLDDDRSEEVDNAFWRIWTFCRIFGSGKGRENDLEGQVDWLRGGAKARSSQASSSTMTGPFHTNGVLFEPPEGFAKGNSGGLTPKELYDMTEIWTCLGVLVQPLHGKCIEARKFGIFKGIDVPDNDPVREETIVEEWTSYILTLGMSAVLAVSPFTPNQTPATILERAKSVGLTKWHLTEPGTSRASFLKEAVSRVYEEQERANPAANSAGSPTSPSELPSKEPPTRDEDRERQAGFSHEIRARRLQGTNNTDAGDSFTGERPMSEFSTILQNLEGIVNNHSNAPPVPPVPPLAYDRSSNSTASPAAPGTPNQNITSDSTVNLVTSRSPPPQTQTIPPPPMHPQVLDPVDRAIARMVGELGFYEDDVKWALKITDTGEGIDVEAAEQLLKQEKKRADRNPFTSRGQHVNGKNSLLASVMKQQGTQDSGWRWA